MKKIIDKFTLIDYRMKVAVLVIIDILLVMLFIYNYKILIFGNDVNISVDKFKSVLENKDYVVTDITDLYDLNNDVEVYYKAVNKDKDCEISFMKMKTKNYATKMFEQERNGVIKEQDNWRMVMANEQINYFNYKEYVLYNNKTYYSTVQVNKNIFYVEIDKKYKDEIPDILDELGFLKYKKFSFLEWLFFILLIIVIVVSIVCWWFIFEKAGRRGWYFLIPGYGIYQLYEIATGSKLGWLLIFIPFGRWILYYKLARAFGKSRKFSVCSMFFSSICLYIISFDNSSYMLDKKN